MPATTYTPRPGAALRVLQHMQRTGKPMSRAQIKAKFGYSITNHLNRAVAVGLLRVEGEPHVFHPTPELAKAQLDGKRPCPVWTPERDAILIERYPTNTNTAALARKLGVSVDSMRWRVGDLGLRKTAVAKRRILQARKLAGRPYVTVSRGTERILQLMRQGVADGATGAQIAAMVGISSTKVGNSLRSAILRGVVVRKPINQRHFTYHLSRALDPVADEGEPLRIVMPAARAPRPITTAPRSVFDLGRAITTHHHASAP